MEAPSSRGSAAVSSRSPGSGLEQEVINRSGILQRQLLTNLLRQGEHPRENRGRAKALFAAVSASGPGPWLGTWGNVVGCGTSYIRGRDARTDHTAGDGRREPRSGSSECLAALSSDGVTRSCSNVSGNRFGGCGRHRPVRADDGSLLDGSEVE